MGLVLQPDGKIVAVGQGDNGTTSDFAIARPNADGSLDGTFDGDGKLLVGVGGSHDFTDVEHGASVLAGDPCRDTRPSGPRAFGTRS